MKYFLVRRSTFDGSEAEIILIKEFFSDDKERVHQEAARYMESVDRGQADDWAFELYGAEMVGSL